MVTLRARGVPAWVTVLAVLLGLFATFLGLSAMADPHRALGYVPGADALGLSWGGRNAGLGVVLLVAVALRRPSGYVVAFAGQLLREVADLVGAFPNVAGIAVTLVFVAVDLLGLGFSLRATRRETVSSPELALHA